MEKITVPHIFNFTSHTSKIALPISPAVSLNPPKSCQILQSNIYIITHLQANPEKLPRAAAVAWVTVNTRHGRSPGEIGRALAGQTVRQ